MIGWIMAGYLGVLSIFDIRFKKVPVLLMAAGGLAALGYLGITCYENGAVLQSAAAELAGAWLPGLFMLAAAWLTGKVGYGDGCILLITGCFLGSRKMAAVFAVSLLLAALLAAVLLLLRRRGRNDKLPYLPFLAAAVICLN